MPQAIKLAGRTVRAGDSVNLSAGYTELEVEYRNFGRAMVVLDAGLGKDRRPTPPLSSPYCDEAMPSRLLFDPYRGKYQTGTFTATVPPGTVDADVETSGEIIEKKIADGLLTVKVAFAPGRIGGGAFKRPIRLKIERAVAELGDWARFEGLRTYSGGAKYTTVFNGDRFARAKSASLCLGKVGCVAQVRINGGKAHVLMNAPWETQLDRSEIRPGENQLEVLVYNTLNNYHQTTPSRYKTSIAETPSGLLGPVTLSQGELEFELELESGIFNCCIGE